MNQYCNICDTLPIVINYCFYYKLQVEHQLTKWVNYISWVINPEKLIILIYY